ncbi:MAG: hemolysin family protein [Verrucomicrobiota bacterium]|jgi:CBS domain containing-hemolysin-like protein
MNWDAAILMLLKILAVLALVLTNGFFVAAEFALVRVRETQLDAVKVQRQAARLARHIVRNLNSYLSATQLGITMASLGLGWIGQPVFAALLQPLLAPLGVKSVIWQHSIAFAVGFSALTFLHITAGELAPKWLTIQRPLPVALWAARPLQWFYLAFYPFNRLLNLAARALLRQIGIEPDAATGGGQTEEELRLAITSVQRTTFDRNIVLNALDLPHRIAREVMRPRHEIATLNTDATLEECVAFAERTRYSRFPLCEGGDLDQTRGVVHIKDLYPVLRKSAGATAAALLPVARRLIYVPETGRLEKLLQLFLERKSHVAMVVDEYGGTQGILTLEDVMEELVGQIQDEFDEEKPQLTRLGENAWEAAGALPLHELEKVVGEIARAESAATASGWITGKLGGFPKVGDKLTIGACELSVEEMDGPLVGRLKIIRHAEATEDTAFTPAPPDSKKHQ